MILSTPKHILLFIDDYNKKGLCKACGYVTIYWKNSNVKSSHWICADSKNIYAKGKHRLRVYGVSPDQWDAMMAKQKGRCAGGCDREATHLDHNHDTGKFRGILCHQCNVAIGLANESAEQLNRLADYVQRDGD